MDPFEALADPVRRRILDLLAEGLCTPGEIGERVTREFGISQPAVSRHLRVLRESGFAVSVVHGQHRLYQPRSQPFAQIDTWLDRHRRHRDHRPDPDGQVGMRGTGRPVGELIERARLAEALGDTGLFEPTPIRP